MILFFCIKANEEAGDLLIKAIIFDFDGVLVDSMDIKAYAFGALFKDYPEHVDEIVKLHMKHGGLSRFEKFEQIYRNILHQPLSKRQTERLSKKFAAIIYRDMLKCPFIRGVTEFLNKYYRQISLFVVSGTPEEELKTIIKKRGLKKYFKGVFGTPSKKKQINQKILKSFHLKPKEVIFVGDSIDDYEGVKGTGIRFIWKIDKHNLSRQFKKGKSIENLFDLDRIVAKEVGCIE